MKTTICTVIICLGAAAPLFADGTNDLNDEKARVSYAIGMSLGRSMQNLQNQGFQFDVDLTARGIQDVLSSNTTLLTMEQVQQTLSTLQKEINAKQQKKREEIAATNKLVGEAFLATNKNNPGVITLPDGLQYRVITNGTGAMPTNTDLVTVNYRGTLLDGTEFDSSYRRGHPANFPVRRRHPRLDGGAHENECRFQMAVVHSVRTGLWRAGQPRHSAEFGSDF